MLDFNRNPYILSSMSNYSSDFDEKVNVQVSITEADSTLIPSVYKDYSLEEYLHLRDNINAQRNKKVPELDEENTLGAFFFIIKYVLPFIVVAMVFAPLANSMLGGMGGSFTLLIISLAFFAIYKVPAVFREIRKQEAINLAEQNKVEYEAFLRMQKREMKKNKRLK